MALKHWSLSAFLQLWSIQCPRTAWVSVRGELSSVPSNDKVAHNRLRFGAGVQAEYYVCVCRYVDR